MQYLGIDIDPSRDSLLSKQGLELIKEFYCLPHEDTPQKAFARAATCYSFGDYDLAQRIYDAVSNLLFMYSSPVLSNAIEIDWTEAPSYNWRDSTRNKPVDDPVVNRWKDWFSGIKKNIRGFPISCFLMYVPDDLEGLISHTSELRWLSVKGGGCGGHWADVRSVSKKAPGPIPFLKTVDSDMTAYRQGVTRKGSYAAYIDISHPDIIEFMNMRLPSSGDENRKCLNLHNAVSITDDFIDAVLHDKQWELVDPDSGEVRDNLRARALWQRIIEVRSKTGEPYIFHKDEANRHLPDYQKEMGLKIHGSNLCSEIVEATDRDRTAVCCLSSLNLEKFEEFSQKNTVYDLTIFLDNVLEFFIRSAEDEPGFERAVYSAKRERSIGIGAMGFQSNLQKHMIPWESAMAKVVNKQMFRHIDMESREANDMLTLSRGGCPDSDGKTRLSHRVALAPNANSSILCNTSAATEPQSSNAFTHRTRIGSHLIRNKYLERYINEYAIEQKMNGESGKWIEEQWKSIQANAGSVQHLEWMPDEVKEVFKTAFEIDQRWSVDHARDRQEFVCQAQSINLFFPAGASKAYVNRCHLRAFMPGGTGRPLKSLYYYRTKALKEAEKVAFEKVTRKALKDFERPEDDECLACHG